MPKYPFKGEEGDLPVSRIVIEPSYGKSEEFPGSLSVMFLDANDRLVDVWSADSLDTVASLLKKHGKEYTPEEGVLMEEDKEDVEYSSDCVGGGDWS